jgi:hypothetical protein
LTVRWTGGQFEVSVPGLGDKAKAQDAAHNETLAQSQRLIVQAQMA